MSQHCNPSNDLLNLLLLLREGDLINRYYTHRPSTGITMLHVTVVTVLLFVVKASVSDIP